MCLSRFRHYAGCLLYRISFNSHNQHIRWVTSVMILVRNLRYREATFAQLWGQNQEPDSGLSRFLSVHFNLHMMLPSECVWVHESDLLFAGLVELCFRKVSGTHTAQFPSLAFTNHMTQSLFSPRASHLHSVIQQFILPRWPKIGPSSSFLHCILVLLWREIVSGTRLEWISCSASGRGGPLTDLWMLPPSSLSKQRAGPDDGVTGAPS